MPCRKSSAIPRDRHSKYRTGGGSALTIIDPAAPGDPTVIFAAFSPATPILDFTWIDGTAAMAGGGPVDTVVTQSQSQWRALAINHGFTDDQPHR